MRVETALFGPDSDQYAGAGQFRPTILGIANTARAMEELGLDCLSAPEAGHDPFVPLAIAAEHTSRIVLGTNVAIAFPRSPMATAQAAWDLQNLSGGRFTLGLGTQVKGHNERRYGTPWQGAPGPRMREYVQCLRAIFATFQHADRPTWFEGRHYRFDLLPPFFNPGPIEHPHVPIYLAAVNPYMATLAGEMCEGLRLHPIATFRYAREVILPAIGVGASRSARQLSTFDLIGAPFMALGRDDVELERSKNALRQQIAFYASTRTYHAVLAHHGWDALGAELYRLSVAGRWREMGALITDEMLDEWAIVATYDRLVDVIAARCSGLFQTIVLVLLGEARRDHDLLRELVTRLHHV